MHFSIHASTTIPWQKKLAPIIQEGLSSIGVASSINTKKGTPILLGPNVHRGLERGEYLQVNRYFVGTHPNAVHETVAIAWNGFNGLGYFCVDEINENRLWEFIFPEDIKPWKDGDEYLLFDQVDNGRSNQTLDSWKKSIKVPYRTRPHISKNPVNMQQDLENVKAALTFNSTAAIECFLYGVPVVAKDTGSPVYASVSQDEETLLRPDRLKVLNYLANCQWTYDEIAKGKWFPRMETRTGRMLHEINPEKI